MQAPVEAMQGYAIAAPAQYSTVDGVVVGAVFVVVSAIAWQILVSFQDVDSDRRWVLRALAVPLSALVGSELLSLIGKLISTSLPQSSLIPWF